MSRLRYTIVCPHCGSEVFYETNATCHCCGQSYYEATSGSRFASEWGRTMDEPHYITKHTRPEYQEV